MGTGNAALKTSGNLNMTTVVTILRSRGLGRKPLRTLVAGSRRANVCNTFNLGPDAIGNRVLLGLSSRSRNRLCVNYTNNVSMATSLRCGRITPRRNSVTVEIGLGNLHKKRSKLRVGRKHTGTGGLLMHFVHRTMTACRTHLTD